MNISSKLLEQAVQAFSSLPGIGKKSALRLALHLLQKDEQETTNFCESISNMRKHIKFCTKCHNLSDEQLCEICLSVKRDKSTVCIVETIQDVMAVENTQHYNGSYHVLGGVISPIEGIGPDQLNIDTLLKRIEEDDVKELIMALSPTIEGDTTVHYISKKITNPAVNISMIARGVSYGGELQYADEQTLGRAISTRVNYKKD